jgi:hypothetical protein
MHVLGPAFNPDLEQPILTESIHGFLFSVPQDKYSENFATHLMTTAGLIISKLPALQVNAKIVE